LIRDPRRIGLRLIPPLPFEAVSDSTIYNIDIVAVHGLGGDFYKTWTTVQERSHHEGVFWLSHLLPADLPGARVFSFGYASRPTFSKSVASVRDYSKQLLQSLLDLAEAVSRCINEGSIA